MTLLTKKHIKWFTENDKRFDPIVDWDEPHKAIVHLVEGWTWNALDGNRSVEGFNLWDHDEPDTLKYFQDRIKNIELIKN